MVFWSRGRLSDDPELTRWMMDKGDCRASSRGYLPTLAQEVDLMVGVYSTPELESQMEIQKG